MRVKAIARRLMRVYSFLGLVMGFAGSAIASAWGYNRLAAMIMAFGLLSVVINIGLGLCRMREARNRKQ
jgi:hypothetical protein